LKKRRFALIGRDRIKDCLRSEPKTPKFWSRHERQTPGDVTLNAARSPLAKEIGESLGGRHLVLGVDRLDYSKGIIQRINAFDRFLEVNPEWRSRVALLQITPRSRSDIKDYAAIENEVTTLIGRVNGRYGEASWTPIRYVNRSHTRTALSGICRAADAALITPLRDGMNLVAKEYVAAQDAEDPGVLILSQFAGAAARPIAAAQPMWRQRGAPSCE
jgi:trehalose 6-phosphate synthase